MRKNVVILALLTHFFILASIEYSKAAEYKGIEFPNADLSFADQVVNFTPGIGFDTKNIDTNHALGIPDEKYVSMGLDGTLVLKFTDNSLTTSGDNEPDLWIFEIGDLSENVKVEISIDGSSWIFVGNTNKNSQLQGVDIDSYIGSGIVHGARYSYIKLTDLRSEPNNPPFVGAEIDAVGAIASSTPVTCSQIELDAQYQAGRQSCINKPESCGISQGLYSEKDGLVAYYPFNGNANDESKNENNGKVFGATLTKNRFGQLNSAYYFDGVDDYIKIENDESLNPESISVGVWVKYAEAASTQYPPSYIVCKMKGRSKGYGIGDGNYRGGGTPFTYDNLNFTIAINSDDYYSISSTISPPINEWIHGD